MKTLIIVAHPKIAASKVNRTFVDAIARKPDVTIHQLYETYPDWNIDVAREQALLLAHDRMVLQFPFYWYSSPPLLKKWFDDVLMYGWAYGSNGIKLHGKELMVAVTTGGPSDSYRPGGYNQFTLPELLRPFQATSNLIGTIFLPIFNLSGVNNLDDAGLQMSTESYIRHVLYTEYNAPRFVK